MSFPRASAAGRGRRRQIFPWQAVTVLVAAAGLSACPSAEPLEGCLCEAGCPGGTLHSADYEDDYLISLSELLRVIQFYNSGGYCCGEGETEDGYAPGPGGGDCGTHASDYAPQDWNIGLSELLRLIQFYNSGGYHSCPDEGTEDGFCPGPGLRLPEPPKRPIAIGVEYALLGLGPSFGAMGLPAVKFLPEQFSWDNMQSAPDAPLDFTRLDQLVAEFQCAGYTDITLGLVHKNSWASIDPVANFAPKPEYHVLYQAWITAIVERFDFDHDQDMPGLMGPINRIEIGVEFSSYEPGPVEDYLTTLELAYTAAHAASETVRVYHVAFFMPGVFDDDPAPEDYEAAFGTIPDRIYIPAYEDFQAILDRPDIFDGANVHFLCWPQEVEPALRWLQYEMGQRGYSKPIIISDTSPSPFAGFGMSSICTGLPNLLALMVRPAVEEDRCRLAEYFTALIDHDPDTLAWVRAHTGIDMVEKTIIAASMGVELINTAFMQDMIYNQPWATAGNAGWGGMTDSYPDLIHQVQVVTRLRAPFYALKQLGQYLVGYNTVTRVETGDPDLYLYALTDSEALQGPRWIAWYEPPHLVLSGDVVPQTTLPFPDAGTNPTVTRVITGEDQTEPESVAYAVVESVPQLPLNTTPIYIVPGM